MVDYGVVSKGCQRCRRQKVKCDQRKPGCLRCEKSNTQCPGYRNLNQVVFRDETRRIVRRVRQSQQSNSGLPRCTFSEPPQTTSYPLSQPVTELGASFFFAKYIFKEPPVNSGHYAWLAQSYLEPGSHHVLRAAIEAVGMAGLSNALHARHVESESRERYRQAVTALKQALNDRVQIQALADTTLMAVILLGLFEIVNFDTFDRYRFWAAHVKAAVTLLELRDQEQFTRERGGQLFVQIRSQILLACVQQQIAVPTGLVQTAYNFENSAIKQQWRHRNIASPGSISEISLRLVNLWAAFNNGTNAVPHTIRETALEIDGDLETWRSGVHPNWRYAITDASEAAADICEGRTHVYSNLWIAEVWNNWRVLRIPVNQIILQNEIRSSVPDTEQKATALSVIYQMSVELCTSISSFKDTPRILSLIGPLYIVSMEDMNAHRVRAFAVEQLRRIGASTGIRQACMLADTVSKTFNKASTSAVTMTNRFTVPLIPFCGMFIHSNIWRSLSFTRDKSLLAGTFEPSRWGVRELNRIRIEGVRVPLSLDVVACAQGGLTLKREEGALDLDF